MSFYLLLAAWTLALVVVALMLWERTGNVAFPMGMAMLYLWSLHGGWSIITDQLGGNSGKHYQYLFDKMFRIELDSHYFLALSLYGAFCLFVGVTALFLLRRPAWKSAAPILIDHRVVLVLGAISGVLSYLLVRDSLALAVRLDESAYHLTRMEQSVGIWFTLHQTLNRLALMPTAIGLAVFVSGRNGRMLVGDRGPGILLGYGIVLSGMVLLCFVLGNKNELFTATIAGSLFYLHNDRRPRVLRLAAIGIALTFLIGLVDYVRSFGLASLTDTITLDDSLEALPTILNSNESFGAHFSMYGVLLYDVPPTYGSSLLSLVASVIPKAFWPDRPPDIYEYYAESINAQAGQGYSIHHATAWYLNFGVSGVFLGAFIFGALWAHLFNLQFQAQSPAPIRRIASAVAFSGFMGQFPTLIRGGPEAYKGAIIDVLIIPVFTLTIACVKSTPTRTRLAASRMLGTAKGPWQRPEKRQGMAAITER